MNTLAVIRFQVEGFHRWPDAPEPRAYLAQSHRHLFHVEVQIEVFHDDREIEFHDLLDFTRSVFPGGDMGSDSCEVMAKEIIKQLTNKYGRRAMQVSVFEDGEVGAVVTNEFVTEQEG